MTSMNLHAAVAVVSVAAACAIVLSSCSSGPPPAAVTPASEQSQKPDFIDSALAGQAAAIQESVEAYAVDHGGNYPTRVDDALKSYFPKEGFTNPATGKANQMPEQGDIKDLESVFRGEVVPATKAGMVQYSALDNGKMYAIVCGGAGDKPIHDPDHEDRIFMLSNVKRFSSSVDYLRKSK